MVDILRFQKEVFSFNPEFEHFLAKILRFKKIEVIFCSELKIPKLFVSPNFYNLEIQKPDFFGLLLGLIPFDFKMLEVVVFNLTEFVSIPKLLVSSDFFFFLIIKSWKYFHINQEFCLFLVDILRFQKVGGGFCARNFL